MSFEQVAPTPLRWRSASPTCRSAPMDRSGRRRCGCRVRICRRRINERWAYRWSVNTAIYISGTHQRRGAGRALYVTLFDLLRHLGYYKRGRRHHAAESCECRAA